MSLLDVKNVSYSYSKNTLIHKEAIKNISFKLDKGDILGVIGHTGSGKSTLMKTLNGLIKPDNGKVFLNGRDIWEDPKNISKICFKIGLVFQYPEYQLFEETAYKDIAFGPKNLGLSDTEIDKRIKFVADKLGLSEDLLNSSPFDLSGGEKRKVAIGGIMAMKPEVLILDEPTAGLDPNAKEMLLKSIIEYKNSNNAAVIIVSHSMEDMAKICDEILVLNNGEAIMQDTTENIFSKTNKLIEIGLDVPMITRIFLKLKELNLVPTEKVFKVEDAVNVIINTINGGVNND